MESASASLPAIFAAAMARLGPFEPSPSLAIAVSGGADSMALAFLARDWVRRTGGSVVGMVVDHALRPSSAMEARITLDRLSIAGIPARLLTLAGLSAGSALAERARVLRYQALTNACREAGIPHLLVGHHAADQTETLAMRILRGSQTHGLAGMSALVETPGVRLLRPLLAVEPSPLRHFLTGQGIAWVEDPSNRDTRTLRARLRRGLTIADTTAASLGQAIGTVGMLRAREEIAAAEELSARAYIRPEGFAMVTPGRIGAAALGSLIRTISGAPYPPSPSQVTEAAAWQRPATVAGVRMLPAGRFGRGVLIVREEVAMAPPIPASDGAFWDNRFRLVAHRNLPACAMIGKLGPDAARFRKVSNLPSVVLRTLPAIRIGKVLAAVPHLGYACHENDGLPIILFSPRKPAAGACFVPAG